MFLKIKNFDLYINNLNIYIFLNEMYYIKRIFSKNF